MAGLIAAIFLCRCLPLEQRPRTRAEDPGCHGDRRRALGQQKITYEDCAGEIRGPLHRQITTMDRTTIMSISVMAGVLSDLVHSGFCVPSRIRRRISSNCLWARDCSQADSARSIALMVS